ncbi:hypothetical protein [Actinacidiphila acididurans]|uniref:Uncharacterized protein n=1 Tax=Actinacidiphila acididurans TaxID=2784346 RepID=A0ABS2U0S4_9ACTN|nr:hypothetical protein [Actinacidiphila acididurans]MBM9509209.1 hypothetical protein [Actinacidiphila acididurans]
MTELPDDVPGIASESHFAAFVRRYQPLDLFARFLGNPFELLRGQAQAALETLDPGTVLERLTINGPPHPLADAHHDWDAPVPTSRYIITRVALFAPVALRVWTPAAGAHSRRGALTCVLANLNQPDHDRLVQSWLDLDQHTPSRLLKPDVDLLRSRMLSVGAWLPSDYPPGSPEGEGRSTP